MNISPFLSLNRPCDETLQWAKEQLSQANFRATQTFDLHAARTGLHDCSCLNHGTDECGCQLVGQLVYGRSMEPVTLILHGNDGKSWISISGNPGQRSDITLIASIHKALGIKASIPVSGINRLDCREGTDLTIK